MVRQEPSPSPLLEQSLATNMKHAAHNKGFFLVEVVVAAAVIATVLIMLLGAVQNSVEASQRSLERSQVSYLLEEGGEAVKALRDNAWSTVATNVTNYYLTCASLGTSMTWSLSATTTGNLCTTGSFVRTVTIGSVYRNGADDIVTTGGTLDPLSKKVTIVVTWSTPSGSKSESLEFYLFDIRI